MAIGRNFQESMHKALRGLETGADGFDEQIDFAALKAGKISEDKVKAEIKNRLTVPTPERIFYIADAFRLGMSVDEVFKLTNIDPWFLVQIEDIVKTEEQVKLLGFGGLNAANLRKFKRKGLSDLRLAKLLGVSQKQLRKSAGTYRSIRFISVWILVPLNLPPLPLICTQPMMKSARRTQPITKKSWLLAVAQTVLVKVLSLITAVCTQPLPCVKTAMRPSW
nr:hypothetical protein [Psychrobacter sp. PraFG1]UNK06134.1 hypothetical protein MN210_05720 [Psychrobacter sp. PraFG1]